MKYLYSFSILLIILLTSCKKDDSNPVANNQSSLNGIWKTNGIYAYMNPQNGAQLSFEFSNNDFTMNGIYFTKDNAGNWKQNSTYTKNGKFTIDNSFLVLGSGNDETFHYLVENNKLTINNAVDNGGIYLGNSNSLTNTTWQVRYNGQRTSSGTTYSYIQTITYNYGTDGRGSSRRVYLRDGLTQNDYTLNFSYSVQNNVLTHIFDDVVSYPPYVAIYEIKDSKLYLYGKPLTSTNDDYYMWELFKQ